MKAPGFLVRMTLAALLALSSSVRADDLVVAAAASLTDALTEIGRAYESRTHTKVVFDFGATSALARQIQAGAPADVFFSADVEHVEQLEQAGLVAHGARRDVLSNTLAIVVPADATAPVKTAADLVPLAHVALADPETVPAGVYAATYLRGLGLWEAIRPHVVPTLDVRAALAAVEGGHADAAIVYRTDAVLSHRVRVAFDVPRDQGPKIVYALAPLLHAKGGTDDLVRALTSPEARVAYERYGFLVL
jgi:molybdate transport system substrate-binding protein